jgi:hypothetical protein
MKRYIVPTAILLLCASAVCAQPPSTKHAIQEVKYNARTVAAPRECLLAFREFFRYVQQQTPGIVKDEQAQKRWLTKELREALMKKVASFTSAEPNPDVPNNDWFIGSWDYPSTYSIMASRRYGNRAIIDVLYKWGPNTNYPGDERTTSFIFLLEDGAWKLDDIYIFRGEFAQTESLTQDLRQK